MSDTCTIGEAMMPSFQGVIPAVVVTSSANGIPNVTYISQVFYVNKHHVALSRQFFNKTVRNISENPFACVIVTCPLTFSAHKLILRFKESRTEGEVFDSMHMQMEVIASLQGKSGTFQLKGADIYEVLSIEEVYTNRS